MNENEIVSKICGEYPENFQPAEINPDTMFIFPNDPSYEAVKVFDVDRNYVFVNSFIECEHYVTGGWNLIPEVDFIQGQDLENFLQNIILAFSIFSVVIFSMYIKRFLKNPL
tara:strand:+ start:458 stop:793 length:336 start_codon:yes stop_codon:yes gene_type:complete